MTDDDQSPKPDFVPYDANAVIDTVKAVFPRSTAELLQQSTGIPMRSITRWIKGEARMPPRLIAKLETQRRLRAEFVAEIRDLYDEMQAEGLTRQAARSALLEIANSPEFEEIDEI
ncbi:hypothetical protein [Aurantimonas sp. HBX-1]|uniref:hypothetical protein n=1 Tax=Aurantimonas sp. HBX-1 TaxID=2906072 RepID=UPI001F341CCE|nr:hypothetical protein [Aurantimonas sp. HBX-1]UIJ73344.1 hypothetical protein LXB15_06805 [Aurantimonas sp. HBX-1]